MKNVFRVMTYVAAFVVSFVWITVATFFIAPALWDYLAYWVVAIILSVILMFTLFKPILSVKPEF